MKRSSLLNLPLVALFLTILWASCSKNHSVDNPNNTNTTTSLVTQASWKFDTSGIDLNKDGTVDVGGDSLIAACEKDDIYTFKSDSTGTIDEGAVKCNVSDPQTIPFKWSINSTQTVLTASAPPLLNGNINIFSLTSAKFILYKDTTVSGISVRYLVSLKHP